MSQGKHQSVSSEAHRDRLAHEYLSALGELSSEINSAIGVLVVNSLPEFQEHVARQEFLASRLKELARGLGESGMVSPSKPQAVPDSKLWAEIRVAHLKLAELNRRFSTFLQYSCRYIGTMTELCRTYEGAASLAVAATTGQEALSCEV